MAKIGLKYPIASLITAESDTLAPTYGTGFVVGKAISADIKLDGGDANILYADDGSAETVANFTGGALDMGVDDLADEIYADLLGHDITDGEVVGNSNDVAPYVGFGFYSVRRKNGQLSYRATWLYKVMFSEPDETAATKKDTIEWQTPAISGKIFALTNGDWKKQKTFATEAAAKAYIEALANIGEPASKIALAAEIGIVNALTPDDYTSETWAALYLSLQVAVSVNANQYATQSQVDAALGDLQAKEALLIEPEA